LRRNTAARPGGQAALSSLCRVAQNLFVLKPGAKRQPGASGAVISHAVVIRPLKSGPSEKLELCL